MEDTQGVQTPDTQTVEKVEPVAKTQESTIDYPNEYKRLLLEVEKQKKFKDDFAKENAEYKRKEREKMSSEEKTAQEYTELVESKKALETQIASYKFREVLSKTGYSNVEVDKIIEANGSPEVYAEIMTERAKVLEKSLKAEAIKTSTPSTPIGDGVADKSKQKSSFALYQEQKQKIETSGKVKL
ncbi:MAG: hypothetical protein EOL95_09435 [Bacteroidia bacterium]|nr:hypothetical protein [Bacteroidia bacterium]